MRYLGLIHLLLFTSLRAVSGQAVRPREASIDVGGAVLSQPGLLTTGVATAAAQLRFATPTFTLGSNGIVARTNDERYTGQGVLSASLYAPPLRRLRWELTGTASAFGVSAAAPAFAWQTVAREHLGSSLGGVFAGVSAGSVLEAGLRHSIFGVHAGGFARLDPLGRDELSMAVSYTRSEQTAGDLTLPRYADAIGYWTHALERFELSAGGGFRFAAKHGSAAQSWASGNAVLWVLDRAAIVAAGGRALADVARGVPSVSYLSLSVRWGNGRHIERVPMPVRHVRTLDDDGSLEVGAPADSLHTVSVRFGTAAAVELMADFTDWEAVPMHREPGGEWRIERFIARGTHRVAIRIDGGKWIVPPNLPRVADEFGGDVGLVVVP